MRAHLLPTLLLAGALGCSDGVPPLDPRPVILAPANGVLEAGVEYTFDLVGYDSELGGEFYLLQPDTTLVVEAAAAPVESFTFTGTQAGVWRIHFEPDDEAVLHSSWVEFAVVPGLALSSPFPQSSGDDLSLAPFGVLRIEPSGLATDGEITFTDTSGELAPFALPIEAGETELVLQTGLPIEDGVERRYEVRLAAVGSPVASAPVGLVQRTFGLEVETDGDQRFVPAGGSITLRALAGGTPVDGAELTILDALGQTVQSGEIVGTDFEFTPPAAADMQLFRAAFRAGTLFSPVIEIVVAGEDPAYGLDFAADPLPVGTEVSFAISDSGAPGSGGLAIFENLSGDDQLVFPIGAQPTFTEEFPTPGRWRLQLVGGAGQETTPVTFVVADAP